MQYTSQATNKKSNLWDSLKQKIKKSEWKLLLPYLLLVIFGVLMVYSSSSYFALLESGSSEYFFIRQGIFAGAGVGISGVLSLLSNRLLKNKKLITIAIMTLIPLLTLLLLLGRATNGAKAWLNIGSFGIQPTELLKVVLILYLAIYVSRNQSKLAHLETAAVQAYKDCESPKKWDRLKSFLGCVVKMLKGPIVCFGMSLLLILLQPDMGGAIIVGLIGLIMFLHSGVSVKLGAWALGVLGALYTSFILIVKIFGSIPFLPEYQVQRFTAFLDPFADAKDSSFQLVNSFYALARGGIWGVGLGESVQKSGYLPESYTDFIVSIIGEELGLAGILLFLVVFFYMVYRIYRISMKVRDPFGQMVCIGIASMFLIQAIINVGGATGLMPLTGVTFPFISYGGSSMLVNCSAIGIVNNIWINDRIQKEKEAAVRSHPANAALPD